MKKRGGQRGEKVPRKVCLTCNSLFYAPPIYVRRGGGKYCSRKCFGIASSKEMAIRFSGQREIAAQKKIENKLPKTRHIKVKKNICLNCGTPCFKIYCNSKCYYEKKKKETGKNLVTIKCLNCGKEKVVTPGQLNAGFGKFCSFSCSSIYRIKINKETVYGNSKGGKRPDLNNIYFRSRWEANYARYLNFLIKIKDVVKWEFESETFYFNEIRRGAVSYTPDFKIWYSWCEEPQYIEIKGYMDSRSKTKLKRMAKYYPDIKIRVIEGKEYRSLSKKFRSIIPNWEVDQKKKSMY